MKCAEVERWLDEGMPDGVRAEAIRHIEACPGCTASVEAAREIEAALRQDALGSSPVAPPAFVECVIARVDSARLSVQAAGAERPLRWWVALATDPVSVVSLTLALLLAVFTLYRPNWAFEANLALVSRASLWTSRIAPLQSPALHPALWLGLAAGFAPLGLWGLLRAYRAIERTILLITARRVL